MMSREAFPALITLAVAGVLFSAVSARPEAPRAGCLWDRDTLMHESLEAPRVMAAITGRFDRFPPLYYEMRLTRVTVELEANPKNMDLYDDAAVACDRLGRQDEAIAWMARKADQLATAHDAEHQYRSLANLGTFHAHRWIARGADRSDLADLYTAEDLIARAIELNPDAHFGRERYQLLAIRWLLEPPLETGVVPTIFEADPELVGYGSGWLGGSYLDRNGYADAAEGLAGLIVLGNAWNSPDIFAALRAALIDQGDASVAFLALQRAEELLADGRSSLYPTEGLELWEVTDSYLASTDHLDAYFVAARQEADDWHAAREAFLLTGLRSGRHPDTHADFWAAWTPTSAPPRPPGTRLSADAILRVWVAAALGVGAGLVGLLVAMMMRRRKAHAQPVG